MKQIAYALTIVALSAFFLAPGAEARGNTPCSGKKGGVSHCKNGKFVCKDGSTSASKRICTRD